MIENLPQWFLYIIAGLLGAILGSFANVCIVRLPADESIVRPASHCPSCGHTLSWWENIPILSYLILRARCRGCGAFISPIYPAVEVICLLLSLLTWWKFGNPLEYFLYFCLLIIPLVIISFIDLEHRIIPNEISIPGIFVGIGVHTILAGSGGYGAAAIDSIIGAVAGGGALFLVAFVYEKIKKQEGLGGGDIKLIAMLGAFFGWRASIFILFASSVIGSIVGLLMIAVLRKDMKYAIPFGPFLAAAGLVYLFVGREILHWYLGMFV
jgi:leader peptidase (prepilin peptidase) / N-methyltransferase